MSMRAQTVPRNTEVDLRAYAHLLSPQARASPMPIDSSGIANDLAVVTKVVIHVLALGELTVSN